MSPNVANNSDEKLPSRFTIQCRDLVILSVSFVFTIAVACFILLHVHNHQQNVKEIEMIVARVLDGRAVKQHSVDNERKRGYLEENEENDVRSKRAAYDSRLQSTGEMNVSDVRF